MSPIYFLANYDGKIMSYLQNFRKNGRDGARPSGRGGNPPVFQIGGTVPISRRIGMPSAGVLQAALMLAGLGGAKGFAALHKTN